ncbi:MAG: Protein GrpE [Chroococcopsis gigantea SAG 12.99]|jgi:molecular chaperone GrpE|nr:nucleotide exchange factor GrpE [Chlorogloea purpurea SAG 13.99]MDV3001317.1 Protein GrpE [Chroococcopsis gigantea SAG 12.99]
MSEEKQSLENLEINAHGSQGGGSIPELTREADDLAADDSTTDSGEETKADRDASGQTSSADSSVTALNEEIFHLKVKLQEQTQQEEVQKNRYISLAAEFDNYRKRTAREKEELEGKIKCKTLTELLAVVDNFERARTQLKPVTPGEESIHKSYQGVYKNLVDSLKRLGVSPMRPEGQPFDPNYHEAMMREYTDEYPEGTVIEQLVRGYVLGEQVLRHALVKVAAPKDHDPNSEPEQVSEFSG